MNKVTEQNIGKITGRTLVPNPNLYKDQDVFVIGGGPSVNSMDLNFLKDKNVIGTNCSYLLGDKIVDICVFGDKRWGREFWCEYYHYKDKIYPGLKKWNNPIICLNNRVNLNIEKFLNIERKNGKLPNKGHFVGWIINTGLSSIHLAVRFGAKNVIILGFDNKKDETNKLNWYPNPIIRRNMEELFDKFRAEAQKLKFMLRQEYPNVRVYDATVGGELNVFEHKDVTSHGACPVAFERKPQR